MGKASAVSRSMPESAIVRLNVVSQPRRPAATLLGVAQGPFLVGEDPEVNTALDPPLTALVTRPPGGSSVQGEAPFILH